MPFEVLNVEKKPDVGRPLASLPNIDQELLYPTTRPITMAKKKDKMELLKYIPHIHQQYYREVRTELGLKEAEPDTDDDCIVYAE